MGLKRPRLLDAHKTLFNIARLYGNKTLANKLEMWISLPPFKL